MDRKLENDNFLYIEHELCSAIVSLQGAQLLSWCPKGRTNILWSADISTYEKGKAFRGGIPICWPWFGKVSTPSHGFARLIEWTLQVTSASEENVILNFTLQDSSETFKIFPHKFNLSLKMTLGLHCKIELFVDADVETTGALHSYFATENIFEETIDGLGEYYTDSLNNNKKFYNPSKSLQINKEVDRIYTHASNVSKLINNHRILEITHTKRSDIVVWNPWYNKIRKILDMQNSDYKKMLCIETAKIYETFKKNDYLAVEIKPIRREG